ncbi:MAG TPA: TolC family protein [Bryobacteraceae bacterium]|nr:TolC family protein [Bryobacteraceae bacterium]
MNARHDLWMAARRYLAAGLCAVCAVSQTWAQQAGIAAEASPAPAIVRPYLAPEAPPVRLANSPRLRELVRAGNLYLTAQDAVALALENNIDLEVARYNPLVADWQVTRAQAGGLLPGVPSNASQAGSVAAGQGVTGSQAAAGVRIAGAGGGGAQTTNVTISQIGPVTQTLDPIIQEASTFSHTSTPQPNVVQSLTPVLITDTRAHTLSFQQGLLTGGSIILRYTGNYLNENSPTDVLNPSSAPNLLIGIQHNLLRGLGTTVNARTITVAKMNVGISDLNFRAQVINVVTRVLNVYYGLAASLEDLKANRTSLDVAQAFFKNVQEQVRIGSVAPPDLIKAEAQVVTSQQAVNDAVASLAQQEIQLKNLISREGTADPVLAGVRIVPVDRIRIPEHDDLPPLEEMVKQALANRSDLEAQRQSEAASQVSTLGTRNGLRPNLQVFAAESHAGLAGTPKAVSAGGFTETPDPYFVGGLSTALGQVFRRNFPTERIGAFYQAPLRNLQAQADYAIDELQFRQTQLSTRKSLNQVEVDVRNNVIALRQARARYAAAVQNRILQQELLAGEQKRFALGTSVPYNVIQLQRDLATAQAAETAALVAYSTARISLDQTLGTTLSANQISIVEAYQGRVERKSSLPQVLPQ